MLVRKVTPYVRMRFRRLGPVPSGSRVG
jgi:hypothetical protein